MLLRLGEGEVRQVARKMPFMKMPKEAAAFRSHGQDLLLEPQTVENMLVEQEEE